MTKQDFPSTRVSLRITRHTYRLRVKRWKKIFNKNRDKKKAEVAILIPGKADSKTKAVTGNKPGYSTPKKPGTLNRNDMPATCSWRRYLP